MQSKLANILFTRELTHRFAASNIIVSAVHPGLVASRFPLTAGEETRAYYERAAASGEALTEDQGADTIVWLADSPEAALPSGGYFTERQRVDPSLAAQSRASAKLLWEQSARLVGLTSPDA